MQPSAPEIHAITEDISLTGRIRLFSWILMASWALLITISWFWIYRAERQEVGSLIFHGIFLLYGLGLTGIGAHKLSRSAMVQKQTGYELNLQTRQLEEEIAERKAAQIKLEELNRSLEERINLAVSDLRHKDKMLIQQGRLAALGEMINNIAHQWRQPLNNIGLIIQNLQISYNSGSITRKEMEEEIGKAMEVIMHMSRTIDDFRNFFRDDKAKSEFLVNNTVHKALDFVSSALANLNIRVDLEEDDAVIAFGYQNEYAQVLLNILSNAREACIERDIAAPHIHIRVTSEKGCSVVYIRDNCGGIAEDVMPKIFDPYFTTRAPDKGTGIGLYMSIVIIEQNMGGSLTARNSEDGVEFRLAV